CGLVFGAGLGEGAARPSVVAGPQRAVLDIGSERGRRLGGEDRRGRQQRSAQESETLHGMPSKRTGRTYRRRQAGQGRGFILSCRVPLQRPVRRNRRPLLAGEAFLVVGLLAAEVVFRQLGGVVGL